MEIEISCGQILVEKHDINVPLTTFFMTEVIFKTQICDTET